MDYELEVFEVYDDVEPQSSKRHLKHTRKKCKQKPAVLSIENTDNDISRSKSSVVSGDPRHLSLRESTISVLNKILAWRDQRRYQSTFPNKSDLPHLSKDYRKGYIPCGKFSNEKKLFLITLLKFRKNDSTYICHSMTVN